MDEHISSLTVAVVDFDGQPPYNTHAPIVGPEITRLALEQAKMLVSPTGEMNILRMYECFVNGAQPAVQPELMARRNYWTSVLVKESRFRKDPVRREPEVVRDLDLAAL